MTFLTAESGTIHLEPLKTYSTYRSNDGRDIQLPFSVSLLQFTTDYYPGMSFPRDFHSKILIDNKDSVDISMNNIGKVQNYRFYQTSFDGKEGSILTVSRDPWGIGLTYAGYGLYAITGLFFFIKKLKARTLKVLACAILALSFCSNDANGAPAVDRNMSDSLRSKQIIFNGRVMSFARMSTELTLKITGNTNVGILDATQFIASLMIYPDEWKTVPFIKVKSRELRHRLNLNGDYVAVDQLYDNHKHYKLQQYYSDGTQSLDSDILDLDEKIALLNQLWNGTIFQLLESDKESRNRLIIDSEILYYRIHPVRLMFIATLIVAFIGFICIGLKRYLGLIRPGLITLFILSFAVFLWQWMINNNIPLDSTSGILFFVAVCLFGILIPISKLNYLATCIGILTAGFVALLSWSSSKDPALTPLMPVLSSPWLGAHVSIIMTSYAMLGLTFPLSLFAICCIKQRDALNALSQKLLLPGVYMLGIGIILGAMWANVSWGRYWAWDPKETWALVTMMLYAIPLHKSLNLSRKPLFMSIYLSLAFLSIVMTYAGVNHLNSLHAYR